MSWSAELVRLPHCGSRRSASRPTTRASRKSRMKPRHAAALAFVGWYLVSPHFLPNSRELNLSLPLSQWSRLGPVLSKSDCEARLSASMRKIDDPAWREKFKREHLP